MAQITKFCVRAENGDGWDCIFETDTLIPNLAPHTPVKIFGTYYFVRFVETNIINVGNIIQFVGMKKGPR